MKQRLTIIAVLILLFPVCLSAQQLDTRAPGIYAIVRGESVPLKYSSSPFSRTSRGWFRETKTTSYLRGGMTSGVIADNTFVLVNDPERSVFAASDPFIKSLTPVDVIVMQLTVNPEKKRREYEPVRKYEVGDVGVVIADGGLSFDWEQITDNSYKITVHGLEPGEYGFVFRSSGSGQSRFSTGTSRYSSGSSSSESGVFGFTIPKGYLEGRITEMNTPIDKDAPDPALPPPAIVSKIRKDLRRGGYNKVLWELEFGYINKSWICDYPSGRQREDLFGDKGKLLHGWNFGALLTPSTDWGLGLRTGLFVEAYFSKSSRITDYCRDYGEFDLYAPLHLSYRIPFKRHVALNFFGGAGFEWAFSGTYNNPKGTEWTPGRRPVPSLTKSDRHEFGNGWPEKINWQAEIGLNYRHEYLGVSFTYGFGLNDHHLQNSFDGGKTFETATRSRQDRMQLSISLIF